MARLVLPARLRDRIRRDARRCYPREACGVLIGECSSEGVEVRDVRCEENVHGADRRHGYTIAPERLLLAQREARVAELEIVGYYHSHPDAEAIPSARDLASAWPDVSYLILAVEAGRVGDARSWRLDGGGAGFAEEAIEYVPA